MTPEQQARQDQLQARIVAELTAKVYGPEGLAAEAEARAVFEENREPFDYGARFWT